jgi:hypothetical protein
MVVLQNIKENVASHDSQNSHTSCGLVIVAALIARGTMTPAAPGLRRTDRKPAAIPLILPIFAILPFSDPIVESNSRYVIRTSQLEILKSRNFPPSHDRNCATRADALMFPKAAPASAPLYYASLGTTRLHNQSYTCPNGINITEIKQQVWLVKSSLWITTDSGAAELGLLALLA